MLESSPCVKTITGQIRTGRSGASATQGASAAAVGSRPGPARSESCVPAYQVVHAAARRVPRRSGTRYSLAVRCRAGSRDSANYIASTPSNIDGAFRDTDKSGAWGFLIRDCNGHGVLAGAGRLRAVHDALAAEGEGCLAALKAAMEYNY